MERAMLSPPAPAKGLLTLLVASIAKRTCQKYAIRAGANGRAEMKGKNSFPINEYQRPRRSSYYCYWRRQKKIKNDAFLSLAHFDASAIFSRARKTFRIDAIICEEIDSAGANWSLRAPF